MHLANNVLYFNNNEYTTIKSFIMDVETSMSAEEEQMLIDCLQNFLQQTTIQAKTFTDMETMNVLTWHDLALLPASEHENTIRSIIITKQQLHGLYHMSYHMGIITNADAFRNDIEFPGLTYMHDHQAMNTLILEDSNNENTLTINTTF